MIATEYCKKVFDGTHDSPKPVENGRLLITSKHIANRSLDISSAYLISEEDFENVNKRSQVHQWDILFSMIGTVGNVYIETSEKIDYAIKNMGVFSCQNKEKAYWLYYYLQSPLVQEKIDALMAGAVQKFVPLGFLRDLDIPEYTEKSKKVVQVLSALDDKIALNKKMNQKLEAMAKRLYDYWFVQYDFPDKNGHPYKTTGGPMTYNPTLKREIPEGWKVKQICDIASFEKESVRPSDNPDIEYKHFSIPGYDECGSYVLETGESILSDKFKVSETDILVSKLNPWTSRVIWGESREHQICSTEFVVMKLHELKEKGFLYSLVKQPSFIDYCTRGSSGTSHSHRRVNPEYMMDYIFAYDKDAVQCFSAIVSQYALMMMKNLRENRRLTALRDKLLPLLMNGQVTVA